MGPVPSMERCVPVAWPLPVLTNQNPAKTTRAARTLYKIGKSKADEVNLRHRVAVAQDLDGLWGWLWGVRHAVETYSVSTHTPRLCTREAPPATLPRGAAPFPCLRPCCRARTHDPREAARVLHGLKQHDRSGDDCQRRERL